MLDLLTSAAADAAPFAYDEGPSIPWGRLILAFLFSIAVALGAILFIRVRNGLPAWPDKLQRPWRTEGEAAGKTGEKLAIVERLNVTPSSQIVVLRRGRQNYLLHLSASGATEIDRFETADAEKTT